MRQCDCYALHVMPMVRGGSFLIMNIILGVSMTRDTKSTASSIISGYVPYYNHDFAVWLSILIQNIKRDGHYHWLYRLFLYVCTTRGNVWKRAYDTFEDISIGRSVVTGALYWALMWILVVAVSLEAHHVLNQFSRKDGTCVNILVRFKSNNRDSLSKSVVVENGWSLSIPFPSPSS